MHRDVVELETQLFVARSDHFTVLTLLLTIKSSTRIAFLVESYLRNINDPNTASDCLGIHDTSLRSSGYYRVEGGYRPEGGASHDVPFRSFNFLLPGG